MTQCCILDSSGKRCKAEVRGIVRLFLDPEHYRTGRLDGELPSSWVLVPACQNHIDQFKSKFVHNTTNVFPTTYQEDEDL